MGGVLKLGTGVAYWPVQPAPFAMHMLNTLALIQDLPQPQGPDLTRYFAVLGGVAFILVMTAIGLRKLASKGSFGLKGSKRSLEIVDVLPLGSRRQLAVVRCYDRTFALGLGEKSVSLLAELDAEMVQHERGKDAKQSPLSPGSALRNVLKPQSRTKAKVEKKLNRNSDDGFESLLDRAQHQLEAKRAAEGLSHQVETRNSNGGLEELC
jgi:flagellar biogenesis protein FliO